VSSILILPILAHSCRLSGERGRPNNFNFGRFLRPGRPAEGDPLLPLALQQDEIGLAGIFRRSLLSGFFSQA